MLFLLPDVLICGSSRQTPFLPRNYNHLWAVFTGQKPVQT